VARRPTLISQRVEGREKDRVRDLFLLFFKNHKTSPKKLLNYFILPFPQVGLGSILNYSQKSRNLSKLTFLIFIYFAFPWNSGMGTERGRLEIRRPLRPN
jgi:hypothetical protein